MSKKIIIFDTETTGLPPEGRMCQLAYKVLGEPYDKAFEKLYNPGVPISIEAMSVHHIRQCEVDDKPRFKESEEYEAIKELFESDDTVMVAHNAPFDVRMLQNEDVHIKNFIDTKRVAKYLDPYEKIPRKNLQYLRYYLNVDDNIEYEIQPHNATSDVIVLEEVYKVLSDKVRSKFDLDDDGAIDKMVEISVKPMMIKKFPMGKYKGEIIEEVFEKDPGYVRWMLESLSNDDGDEEMDMDSKDLLYTLQNIVNIC